MQSRFVPVLACIVAFFVVGGAVFVCVCVLALEQQITASGNLPGVTKSCCDETVADIPVSNRMTGK